MKVMMVPSWLNVKGHEDRRISLFRTSIHKPEPYVKVLVWWANDWYFGEWDGETWYAVPDGEIGWYMDNAEWWMPLPMSPEESR